jgi:hypothetical protein
MGKQSRLKKEKAAGGGSLARMRKSPGKYVAAPGRSEASMLRAAAIHEAGHAVVAIVLKFVVRFVILHVHTDRGIGGYCETAFNGGMGTEEQVLAAYNSPEMLRIRAIQELAGPAAEWVLRAGGEDADAEDVDRGGENDDREAIGLAIQAVGRDKYFAYYRACDDEAHRLVRAHWPACCAVANHLLAHPNQRMPGALVEDLVGKGPSAASGGESV